MVVVASGAPGAPVVWIAWACAETKPIIAAKPSEAKPTAIRRHAPWLSCLRLMALFPTTLAGSANADAGERWRLSALFGSVSAAHFGLLRKIWRDRTMAVLFCQMRITGK